MAGGKLAAGLKKRNARHKGGPRRKLFQDLLGDFDTDN
jgi:hypothetical protein